MKLFKKAFKNVLILVAVALTIIACDKDFASIDSDIINEETATDFNTTSEQYDVISYTDALGPVQSNSLGTNLLGVYKDLTYDGITTANIVTQLSATIFNPVFGENIVLDSVVLTIPYFSVNRGFNEDNSSNYQLQSIFPEPEDEDNPTYSSFKLSIYENNYLLRDFNPNADFNSPQTYFSNKTLSNSELISDSDLEFTPINYYSLDPLTPDLINVDKIFKINNKEIILTVPSNDPDDPDAERIISQRLAPSLRLKLEESFWVDKIINAEPTDLSNANNFNNYFRGIYLKAEKTDDDDGSLITFNLTQQTANIILYYTRDSSLETEDREQGTYQLNFGPNRINFFDNDLNQPLTDGDEVEGDESLFLKGGEGALASIKLFQGTNEDGIDNFEAFRKQFANYDEDGEFESYRRLINEANLVFYVKGDIAGQEPERLYLYDKTNGNPLIDYFQDSQNNTLPNLSIPNHLGVLERDGETEKGIKYKMRITNHISNLLLNNPQNIELGLAVSGNVNFEASVAQRQEQTLDGTQRTVPVSSIITPLGTVLHGNKSEDPTKRLFLEIFYTCLETDIDCPEDN